MSNSDLQNQLFGNMEESNNQVESLNYSQLIQQMREKDIKKMLFKESSLSRFSHMKSEANNKNGNMIKACSED